MGGAIATATGRKQPVRRTKIVATLGPASESAEMIRKLIEAGVNVMRVNFSHGEQAANCATIKRVHDIGREMGEIGRAHV
jgi:pyruvate kinase